jgi:hypothetical protein
MPRNSIKLSRNRTTTMLTIFLLFTFAISIFMLPANAHTPAWNVPTFAYIHLSPNPAGVGQSVIVNFWIDKIFDGATINNDWRFHNYNLTIVKPDGKTETTIFNYVAETGSQIYTHITPDQIGTYTLIFSFPGQKYTDYSFNPSSAYVNDTYLPSSATTTLIVQQNPVPSSTTYPLPSEYWTRPIEGENYNWYAISSNWLSWPQIAYDYQPDGTAPNSPHIMWTKPLEFGGVVGGTNVGANGMTYYTGLSYETRFNPVMIINGRLYYPLPRSNNGAGMGGATLNNGFVCADLRTGQQIFWQNTTMPSIAQIVDIEDMDQHGAIPNGYMYQASGTTWIALDPNDGNWLFNITGVPSGTMAYGPNGELLVFTLSTTAKTLTLWNSSAAIGTFSASMSTWRPVGKVINGSLTSAYSLNATLPWLTAGSSMDRVLQGDLVLGHNGTLPSSGSAMGGTTSSAPWTMWAINLNASRGAVGSLSWMKTYNAPSGNLTITLNTASWPLPVDPVARVFCAGNKENFQWYGYNLDTGDLLWGPVGYVNDSYEYYGQISGGPNTPKATAVYGNLYVSGYGGAMQAIDLKTGNLMWLYNNTYSGTNTPFGHYPLFINLIADGKIYASSSGHGGGVEAPLYRDYRIRCINATDGTEIWTMLGWNTFTPYGANLIEPVYAADGYISYLNVYDMQIYTVGKGPSAMTVEAPMAAIIHGSSIVIRGTVTDISAGTKQNEQAARFPNGVPCVSDASQSGWMEYVYMQKPRPTNATGVLVTLSVVDANGNYREIGTTTSNDGFFTFNWNPDIEGQYTVYASFAGSESYWTSHAMTSFAVDPAAPTASPYPITNLPPTEMYIGVAAAAIIVAIAIATALIILMQRKRP